MIKNINQYRDLVMHQYETGTEKGLDVGFSCLKDLITIKPGYTTFFLGFAAAGKTELHLETLFNLTERYNWKNALISSEIGNIEDVIAELVSKHLKKPFYKNSYSCATEKEIHQALDHLSHYFYPVDPEGQDYTLESFYENCKQIEIDNKIKLNSTSIDPWNDLTENLDKFGGREDKYLSWALKIVREKAKKNMWHNFIVTHAKDMPPILLKSTVGKEVFCTAVPTLQSFAGGQVWGRRAFNVVGVWRPERNAINPETTQPFDQNEAIVLILKSKPKGTGKKGKASLFFHWLSNRYYEKIDGENMFAFEWENIKENPVEEYLQLSFLDEKLIPTTRDAPF